MGWIFIFFATHLDVLRKICWIPTQKWHDFNTPNNPPKITPQKWDNVLRQNHGFKKMSSFAKGYHPPKRPSAFLSLTCQSFSRPKRVRSWPVSRRQRAAGFFSGNLRKKRRSQRFHGFQMKGFIARMALQKTLVIHKVNLLISSHFPTEEQTVMGIAEALGAPQCHLYPMK